MKFKLVESVDYTYLSNNPELQGYDLELDSEELYNKLIEEFTLDGLVSILVDYDYLDELDLSSDQFDMDDIVRDTIIYNMSIYDLLGIDEFRDVIQEFISTSENDLLADIADSNNFNMTHGPEI